MRAYRVAYDGQPYRGFQRQPDVPTVEETLLEALAGLDVLGDQETPPGYAAAGRTDAGVSAVAQTIAFEAPEWLSPAAFNSELPEAVRVWASADAPPGFHATHHATAREYTYFLHAPDASERRAREALDSLAGEHDFHNLTPDDDGTRRTLETSLSVAAPFFLIRLRAGGFPRQLVRRVVSLVASVAREEAPPERVERALATEQLSGPEGVGPAAPEGLVLTGVSYPELSFIEDEEAAARTRQLFDQLRIERSTRARVAEELADFDENL